ncbi:hypothetical protein RJ641_024005 [Dillenia turbinata]|uniref:FHA domain-containing protein n=1 Tax=Dillenia turbinata TaxID=194707 RepID=A0AAN8YTB1_9MAGN
MSSRSMEIQGQDGSKFEILKGTKRELGRGLGFPSDDRTVSRHHIVLELKEDSGFRVLFQVIGKNPIWVCRRGDGDVKCLRRLESGEMGDDDMFCVSGKNPVWFSLREMAEGSGRLLENEDELTESLESVEGDGNFEFDSISVSDIDPVKEFGFLALGHEFDGYPKQMSRDINKWDWFLEDADKDSEETEDFDDTGTRAGKRKRKKDENDDDNDNWTGESKDDKKVIAKSKQSRRLEYSTRSKNPKKSQKDAKGGKNFMQKKTLPQDESDPDDEDEDTLGGFIVNDDEEEGEQETEDEEEEEEEFDEEDDEELDD